MLTQPELIEDIHRAYLEAGADIIETDTFNGTAVSLEEFGLQDHVFEINRAAAELARRAADEFTRTEPGQAALRRRQHRADQQAALDGHPRRRPRPPRRRPSTRWSANYYEQIEALVAGGVDILLPETAFDTLVLKACLFAIDAVLRGDTARGCR